MMPKKQGKFMGFTQLFLQAPFYRLLFTGSFLQAQSNIEYVKLQVLINLNYFCNPTTW